MQYLFFIVTLCISGSLTSPLPLASSNSDSTAVWTQGISELYTALYVNEPHHLPAGFNESMIKALETIYSNPGLGDQERDAAAANWTKGLTQQELNDFSLYQQFRLANASVTLRWNAANIEKLSTEAQSAASQLRELARNPGLKFEDGLAQANVIFNSLSNSNKLDLLGAFQTASSRVKRDVYVPSNPHGWEPTAGVYPNGTIKVPPSVALLGSMSRLAGQQNDEEKLQAVEIQELPERSISTENFF